MTLPALARKGLLFAVIPALAFAAMTYLAGTVSAAPNRLDCGAVAIAQPTPGSAVIGIVEIRGQAQIANFQFYKVEYSLTDRDKWVLIGTDVVRSPVHNGLLVSWQTSTLPEGEYRLRLRAVDRTGNYCESIVDPVTMVRANPTPTIAEPTETAVSEAVPALVPTPTLPFNTPVFIAPVSNQTGVIPTRVLPIAIPELNLPSLAAFFLFGVLVMLSAMLFVGLVLFVRRWG